MSEQSRQKVIWQIEDTHPELVESLKDSLREVVDPEIGLNVIELGLIRDVSMEEDHARLKMILTTPFCPYGPALLEMTLQKAETSLGQPTMIEMGMDMWDFSMMEDGAGAEWGMF